MVQFLHGVETFELSAGPRPIQQVRSAVIGIVGTAPVQWGTSAPALHQPSLVLSDRDNVKFGPELPGYSIPAALRAIQDQGAGTVVVINVFDPATHNVAVAAADRLFTNGVMQLPHVDVLSVVVKVTGGAGAALVLGTDYSFDGVKGTITRLVGGALAAAAGANVAYTRANPAAVLPAAIVGTVTGGGVRQGAQALLDVAPTFGFKPKILIAPGYSSDATVAAALATLAQQLKLRAIALADAAVGTSRDAAITARGPAGAMNAADQRVVYCYPFVKVGSALEAYSPRLAGVIARTDALLGYWYSPSNKQIQGVTGIELPLTAAVNDPACDVNALNAAGIMTIFTGFGAGIRTWGNRSSAFPGSSDIGTFLAVRRTIDVVDESIELAALEHIDKPIGPVLVDAILADVNAFIRTLVTRGALMAGSRVEWFAEDNAPVDLAAGKLTFTKTFCPPPPAERITYKSVVDTTLLAF